MVADGLKGLGRMVVSGSGLGSTDTGGGRRPNEIDRSIPIGAKAKDHHLRLTITIELKWRCERERNVCPIGIQQDLIFKLAGKGVINPDIPTLDAYHFHLAIAVEVTDWVWRQTCVANNGTVLGTPKESNTPKDFPSYYVIREAGDCSSSKAESEYARDKQFHDDLLVAEVR
jgi:hypothetical protein